MKKESELWKYQYLKTKIKSYDGNINTYFHGNKMAKENVNCICLSTMLIYYAK